MNATIPSVKQIILDRDERKLTELAQQQAEAGANYIDVNVATGVGTAEDEIEAMKWAVKAVRNVVDRPICIDSADPEVLKAGLEIAGSSALLNSTTAEPSSLERVLPLAKAYDTLLIALAMDENGIPGSTEGRVSACRKIADACEKQGVALDRLFFDPLVMPLSVNAANAMITIETIVEIKKFAPSSKTVSALSNISFGLPARVNINSAFLHMAIYAGLDAAILDPLETQLITVIRASEAVLGKDRHFRKYSRMFRKKQ